MHDETLPAGKATPRYRCGGDDRARCHQTANQTAVDKAVLSALGALLDRISNDPQVQESLRGAWRAHQHAEEQNHRERIRTLEARIEKARPCR